MTLFNSALAIVLTTGLALAAWAEQPDSSPAAPPAKAEKEARKAEKKAAAEAGAKPKGNQKKPTPSSGAPGTFEAQGGSLEDSLLLLNQWGKQSEAVNQIYTMAYTLLSASAGATYGDLAGNAEFQRLCRENNVHHLGGPMLGAVAPDGARVWVRTVRPAQVEVRVTVDGAEKTFGPARSTPESDLTAIVHVSGLKPSTRHPYRVLVDGKAIPMHQDAVIATAPEPDKPGTMRIAFGSCFHRWGLGNQKQADLIRTREPSALLIYGDIAVQDRGKHVGLHRADYQLRDFMPAWQSMIASVPVYATWDDHDYFGNDQAGQGNASKQQQRAVLEAYRRAWNNPSYGFEDERGGIFLRTRIGPADVIMTDNRYLRPSKQAGGFLGDDQMKWLEAQLLDCKGPFIILSCGTMWSDYVSDGKDSWGEHDPKGRERIFELIEKNRIAGVLLISGDRHGARAFKIPRPSGFTFYEFEPASLGARSGEAIKKPEWKDNLLIGMVGRYAFGEFTFDTAAEDPSVTFRLIRDDAKTLYEITLTRSQLTPPAQ